VVALCLGRAVRFFLIAEVMQWFGVQVRRFVDKHWNSILWVFLIKCVLTVLFFWVLGQ
jgi:hypothetical protein